MQSVDWGLVCFVLLHIRGQTSYLNAWWVNSWYWVRLLSDVAWLSKTDAIAAATLKTEWADNQIAFTENTITDYTGGAQTKQNERLAKSINKVAWFALRLLLGRCVVCERAVHRWHIGTSEDWSVGVSELGIDPKQVLWAAEQFVGWIGCQREFKFERTVSPKLRLIRTNRVFRKDSTFSLRNHQYARFLKELWQLTETELKSSSLRFPSRNFIAKTRQLYASHAPEIEHGRSNKAPSFVFSILR